MDINVLPLWTQVVYNGDFFCATEIMDKVICSNTRDLFYGNSYNVANKFVQQNKCYQNGILENIKCKTKNSLIAFTLKLDQEMKSVYEINGMVGLIGLSSDGWWVEFVRWVEYYNLKTKKAALLLQYFCFLALIQFNITVKNWHVMIYFESQLLK
jgi:hypothetical protein